MRAVADGAGSSSALDEDMSAHDANSRRAILTVERDPRNVMILEAMVRFVGGDQGKASSLILPCCGRLFGCENRICFAALRFSRENKNHVLGPCARKYLGILVIRVPVVFVNQV